VSRSKVDSNLCSGRFSSSRTVENVKRLWVTINGNCRLSTRVEEDFRIPKIISWIFTEDLGMNCVIVKFVPRVLMQEEDFQKDFWVEVAEDILESIKKDSELLKKIMTFKQKHNLCSRRREKSLDLRKHAKVGAIWKQCSLFSSTKKVVHHEYAPQGHK